MNAIGRMTLLMLAMGLTLTWPSGARQVTVRHGKERLPFEETK
jgi:hypothetical protein